MSTTKAERRAAAWRRLWDLGWYAKCNDDERLHERRIPFVPKGCVAPPMPPGPLCTAMPAPDVAMLDDAANLNRDAAMVFPPAVRYADIVTANELAAWITRVMAFIEAAEAWEGVDPDPDSNFFGEPGSANLDWTIVVSAAYLKATQIVGLCDEWPGDYLVGSAAIHFLEKLRGAVCAPRASRPKRAKRKANGSGKVVGDLTRKQGDAWRMVMRHNGNIAAAARELGKDPKTVKQAFDRAVEILDKMDKPSKQSKAAGRLQHDPAG